MAGDFPSQLWVILEAEDRSTRTFAEYNDQLERAARNIDALAESERQQVAAARNAERATNRKAQATLEASRGIEDFVIVASQQGLSLQGISNAMRGASNNISQYVALQFGAEAASLAAGLAIGAVLIPKLIEMVYNYAAAKGPIEEVTTALEDQMRVIEGLAALQGINVGENQGPVGGQIEAIDDQISAGKQSLKELQEQIAEIQRDLSETNFTDLFSSVADQEADIFAIERAQHKILGEINELEQRRASLKAEQAAEEQRIKDLLAEQKDEQKIISSLLQEAADEERQNYLPHLDTVKEQLVGAGFDPLTVEQAVEEEEIRRRNERRDFEAREALGLKTPFEIKEEERKEREAERQAEKDRREEEKRQKKAGNLREQLSTDTLGLGGLDKGVGIAKEFSKFVNEARENLPEGERTAAIEEFFEVQRRRAGELVPEDKPVNPAIRDLLSQQKQVQLDALKADDPHKQKMEENARIALDLMSQILDNFREGGGSFFQ